MGLGGAAAGASFAAGPAGAAEAVAGGIGAAGTGGAATEGGATGFAGTVFGAGICTLIFGVGAVLGFSADEDDGADAGVAFAPGADGVLGGVSILAVAPASAFGCGG